MDILVPFDAEYVALPIRYFDALSDDIIDLKADLSVDLLSMALVI